MSFVLGPADAGGPHAGGSGVYGGAGPYAPGGVYAGRGGGACGDACGPICGEACGDACGGGFDRHAEIGFIGSGGDYMPASYRYVGRGAGQYGLQETRIPRPCGGWCCLLIPCAVLLLLSLLPALYYVLQPGTTTSTAPPTTPEPATTSLPYDCTTGSPELWSGIKKMYCCEMLGTRGLMPVGCQEPVAIGSG